MSKERSKGNPPTPTTLSSYTICLPPSNHSSCSDITSESHPMISYTANTSPYRYNHATLPDIATPQTTFLSYQTIPPPSCRILRVSQCLCLSVTQFLPHHPWIPIIIPKYLCLSFNCDTRHESSANTTSISSFFAALQNCILAGFIDTDEMGDTVDDINTMFNWFHFNTWTSYNCGVPAVIVASLTIFFDPSKKPCQKWNNHNNIRFNMDYCKVMLI